MLFALLVALLLCHGVSSEQQQRRTKFHRQPHVLLILADDLGFNDVPWHNPTMQVMKRAKTSFTQKVLITPLLRVLQAPTMAGLAKQGVILEQNYVQPKCAPSRAALMTGETWHPSNFAGL